MCFLGLLMISQHKVKLKNGAARKQSLPDPILTDIIEALLCY